MQLHDDTKNSNQINLNEFIFMLLDKAASEPDTTYFDFLKIHDHILTSGIKKYTMDIRKVDFTGFDAQKIENVIESVSTELYDNITKANLDYLRHGMKIGARLLAELVI